jgi:hypothetical protein
MVNLLGAKPATRTTRNRLGTTGFSLDFLSLMEYASLEMCGGNMGNIVLHLSNDIDVTKIISLLEPFGKAVTVETLIETSFVKEPDESVDWLGKIYHVDDFKPLKREDIYDRQCLL